MTLFEEMKFQFFFFQALVGLTVDLNSWFLNAFCYLSTLMMAGTSTKRGKDRKFFLLPKHNYKNTFKRNFLTRFRANQ